MKLITNNRYGKTFGEDRYMVVANVEMLERGHDDDPRTGVCLDRIETEYGTMWSTHEYNAEKMDEYYSGHYWMKNELGAWKDYFERALEVQAYVERWQNIKAEEAQHD